MCYNLDMGCTVLNALQKKTFTIANTSEYYVYKFEIMDSPNLIILPRSGHLKELTSKDIVATFSSKEPVQIIKVSPIIKS